LNRQRVTTPALCQETLTVAAQVTAEILSDRVGAMIADDVVDAVAQEFDSV
jgi:hypothetical protein